MHRDILLDAQIKANKSAFKGFAIRSKLTGVPFAWFAEEPTAHTFAAAVRNSGAQCEVVAVIGVMEERNSNRPFGNG
jgi:predicted HAD superfamily phosphohydrolase YqeG